MFNIPTWSMIDNPYHYARRGKDRLVITVGDSWTYGDSIGKTRVREGRDDTEYRLEHIYGNIVSKAVQADWINLALPGGSNRLMLSWLTELLKQDFKYDSITCIITLTESGRHEEQGWVDSTLPTLQLVLEKIVTTTYSVIDTFKFNYPAIKFIVAHNFTDRVTTTALELNWVEVMVGQKIQNNTFVVISDYIKYLNNNRTFPDKVEVIDRALTRLDILDQCSYCNKEDSRHPTEQGHTMWAEYLISQL